MRIDSLRLHYAEEHRAFWTYVDALDDDERRAPSLCAGWSVGDVIHHVAAWERVLGYDRAWQHPLRLTRFVALFARAGGSADRINERLARSTALLGVAHRRHLFDRLTPGAQLAELVIHHQDIRRALEQPRTIPSERLAIALDGVRRVPGLRVEEVTAGRTWRATDVDWSLGQGAEVIDAPGEAILLALAGRPVST